MHRFGGALGTEIADECPDPLSLVAFTPMMASSQPASATPMMSIVLFVIAAIAGAVGQFLYKSGAEMAARSAAWTGYFNWRIALGVLCYTAVMVLFVAAFRRGGSLAVLYPIYASTFIWAALIGWWAYGEPIRPVNVAGMLVLVLGMYLMGR